MSTSTPDTSGLASAVNAPPQIAPQDVAASAQPAPNVATPPQQATLAPQPSRLMSVLGAIVHAGTVGLQGIPDKGRPSFVTGLGEGARAENAAQAQQQDIKFKSFDDQVRVAQLHNQDLHLANATQEEQDAHEEHMNKMHAGDEDWGIQYDQVPNDGGAVMDNLKTQTAANGAASVPAGTHISPDGKFILVPKQSPATDAGQLKQYNALAPVFGMPTSPSGATKLDPKVANVFYNRLQGFTPSGDPYTADLLPSRIASNQSLRDELAKNGATSQVQLDALDGIISKQKAQLKANNDQADTVAQRKTDAANDVNTTKISAQGEQTRQTNASKPVKPVDSTELNSVAFDPNYANPDGTKGGNVVMSKADAAAKGLQHYKADPTKLNATVAGFNDVQNKINMLADVANDSKRMGAVQPDVAAALLESGDGVQLGAFGTKIDMTKINANIYAHNMEKANQATRDYVTAMLGAHEAITQLPRLQTFGQSSRMTQQQMQAAQKLLPQPGDAPVARQKMVALQQMLDPLRKQVPHMPGAESMPSWLEKQK